MKKSVGIIGGGVAGIVAGFALQDKYNVTIIDKNNYLGGHTNTILVPSEETGADIPIDTGFIVCNDRNYPTFHKFLKKLDVPVRFADMSFGVIDETSGLQYGSKNINTIFAQRRNIFNPKFLRFLVEIKHFWNEASKDVGSTKIDNLTLKDYLASRNIHPSVINDFIVPISAAIWSTPDSLILDFPVGIFLAFFHNHGLLNIIDQPRWQTVIGGSFAYVKKFKEQFNGELILNNRVEEVNRSEAESIITLSSGEKRKFDKVVFATHADEVLPILKNPSMWEEKQFGVWNYLPNQTFLHTDSSFLPTNKRAQASWNYLRSKGQDSKHFTITYYMNKLQGLSLKTDYCVTLNPLRKIDSKKVIKEISYHHPHYTVESLKSQKELLLQRGEMNTWYCGSYFGFGFHEDAVKSGLYVAEQLGGCL